MKKNENFILMADIIDSREYDQKQLMLNFKEITQSVSLRLHAQFLSPITITLGDEFQSVTKNLDAALQIIIGLEEEIVFKQSNFKLRYVLVEGKIDTPINETIAYGMLGEGLIRARQALLRIKLGSNRFYFELRKPKASNALNDCFIIFQSLIDSWKLDKDHDLIMEFLRLEEYKKVAEALGKTRSQIWKREKSLKISEYIAIKKIIHYIGM